MACLWSAVSYTLCRGDKAYVTLDFCLLGSCYSNQTGAILKLSTHGHPGRRSTELASCFLHVLRQFSTYDPCSSFHFVVRKAVLKRQNRFREKYVRTSKSLVRYRQFARVHLSIAVNYLCGMRVAKWSSCSELV